MVSAATNERPVVTVPILLIGGTTASGKSELALCFAERTGALVVNADAQQLYRDLPLLSARPGADDMARAAHRLYGMLDADMPTSAGAWLGWLRPVIAEAETSRRPLCLVGGTGLYMKALLEGLAPVPEVPAGVRERLRQSTLDTHTLHAQLAARDPAAAARLRPSDRQRILRALEVLEATGRSLVEFQRQTQPPYRLQGPVLGVALLPSRDRLHARIAARFERMLAAGALAEVEALAQRYPDPAGLPVARLHGCRELLRVVRGEWTLKQAAERAILVTRQYAKRQSTFFRTQLPGFHRIAAFGEEAFEELVAVAADLLLPRARVAGRA